MDTATEVKNVYVPIDNPTDDSGKRWLIFRYGEEDKNPWQWPKVMTFGGRLYKWMSWNSDTYRVNYKEISETEVATVYRRK